jgi:DNA-binding MarR family transcriptional regulator
MSHPNVHLCLSIHHAYARLRFDLDEQLGTYHGIDLDDYALLHMLASDAARTTSLANMAAGLSTSRSALLRRLRPLEKIGLLACHGGIGDRRIALRAPGLSLMKTAHDTIVRVCDKASLATLIEQRHLTPAVVDDSTIDQGGQWPAPISADCARQQAPGEGGQRHR